MIKEKYIKEIREEFKNLDTKNLEIFIFGSSINKKNFGDIDIGISGKIKKDDLVTLKERFDESTIPYNIDLVHINNASNEFKKNIFNSDLLWIKHLNSKLNN